MRVLGSQDRGDITSFAISPIFSSDSTLFVGVSRWDRGVLRSTDGGRTWQKVYGGLRGLSSSWVAVSPAFASDNTLFAGKGGGGVFRSTNRGKSWKKASKGIFKFEDSGRFVIIDTLAISPFFDTDSTLLIGTSKGILRSTDRGDTWQKVIRGIPGYQELNPHVPVNALAISPNFDSDSTLFAVTGRGTFRSTDRGDTWWEVGQGLSSANAFSDVALSPSFGSDDTLFMANKSSLFGSTDRGDTWRKVYDYCTGCRNHPPWVALSPNFASDNTLFTSKVRGGVFRSTNRGDTWQKVSLGLPDTELPDFVFFLSFSSDGTVFVMTEDGLFRRNGF